MTSTYAEYSQNAKAQKKWSRDEVSTKIIDFKECKKAFTQREFAKQAGVPRTTLQNWLTRMEGIDADPVS